MPDIKFLHGNDLSTDVPVTPGAFYLDVKQNELWYDDPSGQNANHVRLFDGVFKDIYKKFDDINYKKIEIKTFSCTNLPSPLQIGCTVNAQNLDFTWTTSKDPVEASILINGSNEIKLDPTMKSVTLPEQSFGAKRTYTLKLEDDRTADNSTYPSLTSATKDYTFNFYYPLLYGSIPKGSEITSELLNETATLTAKLTTTPNGTYTMKCGEISDNRVSFFAYPAQWGNVKMTFGGQVVEWSKDTLAYEARNFLPDNVPVSFSSKTITYNVYYGSNEGLGDVEIVITKI